MTSGSATKRARERAETVSQMRATEDTRQRRLRAGRIGLGILGLGLLALVVAAILSARPQTSAESGPAPDFTLPVSDGTEVTLSDLRGEPVILYFNEGAGCDSCIVQMDAIEEEPGFAEAGITVLPIVMNSAEQINHERSRLGVATPFLLDDGTVSAAYGTLGTGMHEGLPGHGFVLVDEDGTRVWSGDYPSMWLDPSELLEISLDHLES